MVRGPRSALVTPGCATANPAGHRHAELRDGGEEGPGGDVVAHLAVGRRRVEQCLERRRHALTTGGTRSGKADNACNEHGHDLLWLLLHHAESVPVRVDEDDEVGVVRRVV